MKIPKFAFSGFCSILLTTATAQAEFIQSESYPLRVHYEGPTHESAARAALDAAEQAWAFQVDELGFLPPPEDSGHKDSNDFDVVLGNNPWGASASILAPATDRELGYSSQILVDPTAIPDWAFPLVISHEFHHAIQLGIRPMNDGVMEGGALLISQLHTGQAWVLSYYLGINAFQANPERSLDWQADVGDFFPYGTSLFFLFLEQQYGEPATAALYKSMWDLLSAPEAPDYFDALAQLIDFDAAFTTFSTWRYFVGPQDDGQHIQDLADWEANADGRLESVALVEDLAASDLPTRIVSDGSGPMPYGATYVRVDLTGLSEAETLHVRFTGDPNLRWSVGSILTASDQPTEEVEITATDGLASLEVPGGKHETLVVVCTNLGNGQYVPDGSRWWPSTLALDLQILPTNTDVRETETPPQGGCRAISGTRAAVWVLLILVFCRLTTIKNRATCGDS
ncbi:hypothetical protein ACFL6C_09520 [Myxococcota bacterium]